LIVVSRLVIPSEIVRSNQAPQCPSKRLGQAITRDQYKVGDFVSTDQFICKRPVRLPTGYERESQDRHFQGSTIYNDAASGLIWVENQVSLGANETIMGKARFEQWLWDQCVSEVKYYHGDNGIFLC